MKTRPMLIVDNTSDPPNDAGALRVRDSVKYIKDRLANMRAGVAWCDIGRELLELRTFLRKVNNTDDAHSGWRKAFRDGTMPFARTYATKLIDIHEALGDTIATPKVLPASVHALHALSKIPSSRRAEVLQRCQAATTSTDVNRIARELGVTMPKNRKAKKKQPSEPTTFDQVYEAFRAAIAQLPEKQRAQELRNLAHDLGLDKELRQ